MLESFVSFALASAALVMPAPLGDQLAVTDVSPDARIITAPAASSISIDFDRPVDPLTVDAESFWAFGRWSGTASGSFVFSDGNQTVTLVPDEPFFAGEQVTVYLSHDLAGADAAPMRPGGYSYQFWVRALGGSMQFTEIADMTTRRWGSEQVRSYGGAAPDLDGDGYPDLVIVNEISEDVRVFMNDADGAATFTSHIKTPYQTNTTSSPSETGDFNRDGHPDMCISNVSADTVSILLGNGDGSFGPQQEVAVGEGPYGITVIDRDGDGDQDVVLANRDADHVSVLDNDGAGFFTLDHTFLGGGDYERVAWAADMDEDGILDIVVGTQDSNRVIVHKGNGDGTFSWLADQDCGGPVRTLVCGDLNGDGHEDIATANGLGNSAGVMFGNGDGTLQPVVLYTEGNFTGATDLADLDGDGDLDWSLSHFLGDWVILENDGNGGFTETDAFPAPEVASCSILADLDRDGDVDLVLVDEFADEVYIRRNDGSPGVPGDVNGDGMVDVDDLIAMLSAWGPCPGCPEDLDGDGAVTVSDLLIVLSNWG